MIELEQSADRGRYEALCIRALANAALLLDQPETVTRGLKILQGAPESAFFAGAIANFEFPCRVPEAMRGTESWEVLNRQYPVFEGNELLSQIQAESAFGESMRHCVLCFERRINEARSLSIKHDCLHEVAETLCVIGDFASAEELMTLPEFPISRTSEVLIVMSIELLRHNRDEQFRVTLNLLESAGLSPWERIALAIGFSNRLPWIGYPFADG